MSAHPATTRTAPRRPLDWSRASQMFRHLDGSPCNWRDAKPGWQTPRDVMRHRALRRALRRARLRRLGQWAIDFIHPDPRERRKIYIYVVLASWAVMITMGLLAAHGILPR